MNQIKILVSYGYTPFYENQITEDEKNDIIMQCCKKEFLL